MGHAVSRHAGVSNDGGFRCGAAILRGYNMELHEAINDLKGVLRKKAETAKESRNAALENGTEEHRYYAGYIDGIIEAVVQIDRIAYIIGSAIIKGEQLKP